MKNNKIFLAALTIFILLSCSTDRLSTNKRGNYIFETVATVPIATNVIYVEYQTENGTTEVREVPVSPKMLKDGSKLPEPFGEVELRIASPKQTTINAYYLAHGQKINIIDNAAVIKRGRVTKSNAALILPEPKSYKTSDLGFEFYHSSGTVMFEDSWPSSDPGKNAYDYDFDDVVVDYDLEAKTVPDELLSSDGWREQVKVVLHLRAVGSNMPARVGLVLEGFNTNNVETIEQYCTLDSYGNEHGKLPKFTETKISNNCRHGEENPTRPWVEIAQIMRMNESIAGEGANAEYDYINGDFVNHTVFNLTYGFKPEDKSQYSPELETMKLPTSLKAIQGKKYYNCIPGYINVAGGLFTYTVIYNMKPRKDMSPQERQKVLDNMIAAVMNTNAQNFYIINKDWKPVQLKGYPLIEHHSQAVTIYNNKLTEGVNNGDIDADNPYVAKNGQVWGIKCPTLTRHIWNKLYFSMAYPNFSDWVVSNGVDFRDWYLNDVDERFLSCWW